MDDSSHPGLSLGCTYWPRLKGPWFWREQFDRGEVRFELQHLADLGCRVVRVLLPWEAFQPSPERIAPPAFDRFALMLDAAEAARVQLIPALFVGGLGGSRFVPRWLLQTHPTQGEALPEPLPRPRTISDGWLSPRALQNLYEQRDLLDAQVLLIRELVGYFASHAAIAAWDLGAGDLLGYAPARAPEAALAWLDFMVEAVREAGAEQPIWYGARSRALLSPSGPRLGDLARAVTRLAIATIPYDHQAARGPADSEFVLYTLQLAGLLTETEPDPLGCVGTGVPTAAPGGLTELIEVEQRDPENPPRKFQLPSEEAQFEFYQELLPAAHAWGVPFVFNMTYADTPAALESVPPFDRAATLRRIGLVRADGSEKPAAAVWRDVADRLAHGELGDFGREDRSFEVDLDEFYRAPGAKFAEWYHRAIE